MAEKLEGRCLFLNHPGQVKYIFRRIFPSQIADYLQEMKIKMEKAAESASLTAAQKQKSYGDYFNKRSSVKNFSIGEQVVLLIPDSSNKIYARWTGPGEIIQHHPPHSYKVKLSDGIIRHVHVNKIRNYHPRALASGVIFEDDHEFGEIHPTPNLSRSTSERVLHETDLNHLKETEREQVLAILLKHRTLFTSDVKIAKVGAHRIRLKPNIERKKPFLYRILDAHHLRLLTSKGNKLPTPSLLEEEVFLLPLLSRVPTNKRQTKALWTGLRAAKSSKALSLQTRRWPVRVAT
ncbi:retrovirus-related Pol polyprotein from transposon 17.6 [Trichonephila clavata]|uniref:Retrovirus-related Pol polyprotein from transposon 17.6 n=1 Tax=Trichonephila clavata TaxID=2740835 RepID=A0A8X6FNL2_TRICU|nr:retrovirus-related Pol polyprotein from transposon 17.6 [Trichonephila clavata]